MDESLGIAGLIAVPLVVLSALWFANRSLGPTDGNVKRFAKGIEEDAGRHGTDPAAQAGKVVVQLRALGLLMVLCGLFLPTMLITEFLGVLDLFDSGRVGAGAPFMWFLVASASMVIFAGYVIRVRMVDLAEKVRLSLVAKGAT